MDYSVVRSVDPLIITRDIIFVRFNVLLVIQGGIIARLLPVFIGEIVNPRYD